MIMTQCDIGKIGLIEDNVLLVDIKDEAAIEVEHVTQLKQVAAQLTRSTKIYNIINSGAYSLPTKEAREHYSAHGVNPHILGRAFVVHDMGQLILAKHIVKQEKLAVPTQIFTDLDKAQKWVQELKLKNREAQLVANS